MKTLCLLSIAIILAYADIDWENYDYAHRLIKPAELSGMDEYDLANARGFIFGRHGRIFKERDIQEYIESYKWYKPDPNFSNSSLNDTERKNIDSVRGAEAAAHEFVQLGDLRFYHDTIITPPKLGTHSQVELHILEAELEAIHGKRFEDEPWLQNYFEERYWYKPSDHYNERQLGEIETKNLKTIHEAYLKQRSLALSPGDMQLYQDKPITEALLHGLSLYELRVLRNEIYARRGKRFNTKWLQQYFANQDWYKPETGNPKLSETDLQNVKTILAAEQKLHDQLASKVIDPAVLHGVFLEDARKLRNEIYARHGRVFKDPWLQSYFRSFDWYQPDTSFDDASLTEIEKQNVRIVADYETEAMSELDAFEG